MNRLQRALPHVFYVVSIIVAGVALGEGWVVGP